MLRHYTVSVCQRPLLFASDIIKITASLQLKEAPDRLIYFRPWRQNMILRGSLNVLIPNSHLSGSQVRSQLVGKGVDSYLPY